MDGITLEDPPAVATRLEVAAGTRWCEKCAEYTRSVDTEATLYVSDELGTYCRGKSVIVFCERCGGHR